MGRTGLEQERPNNDSHLSLQPNGEAGKLFVPEESILYDPRKERIEWWRKASESPEKYLAGEAIDKDGNPYEYPAGTRLIIGKGKEAYQVMDSCETPWAFATVDMAFKELGSKSGEINVLERGFGMGITARRVIHNLMTHGGSYTIIELNEKNAAYAREWKRSQEYSLTRMTHGMQDTKPNISIDIIDGEAYQETAKLLEAERKFDIIISDTYPLTADEQGINDLQDLDVLKRCLNPGGVFAFFAYFPGSTGGIMKQQRDIINEHFRNYNVGEISVNPPPTYKYLQTDTGPVRSLPIVICKDPKI